VDHFVCQAAWSPSREDLQRMESACCGITDWGGLGRPEDSLRDQLENRLVIFTEQVDICLSS